MLQLFRKKAKGFTLIELLIVVTIIGILAAIAIPNLLSANKKAKYARAASDTKTAVTQGIVYMNDQNANPGTVDTLRTGGFANVASADPWGGAWAYSVAFASTATPADQGELAVCSEGPAGAKSPQSCGSIGVPGGMTKVPASVTNGSVGYSNIYGSWQGSS